MEGFTMFYDKYYQTMFLLSSEIPPCQLEKYL